MAELLPFFIVLFAGVFFSVIFARLHVPWVVALILGGVIIGPFGFDLFQPNDTISFISKIGLVFLMFMAGLETQLSSFSKLKKGIAELSLMNALIPLFVGVGIGIAFGFSFTASLLLGIIFVSSSIAVVIPTLESTGLAETKIGRLIVSSTIVEDILSLALLSVLLQSIDPATTLPLPVFYLLLVGVLYFLRKILPKIEDVFARPDSEGEMEFQQELRSVFMVLVGTVVAFELLGLHAIIAGFFAGLVLSETISSDVLIEKIRAIGYGIFIPTFFIVVGMQADISVFTKTKGAVLLVGAVVIASVLSKFISGYLAGRVLSFSSNESGLIGSATIPQLSTTLAVAFSAAELGLVDQSLLTAMIVLSIVTTLLSPVLVNYFATRINPA